MNIRNYNSKTDYPAVEALYKDSETFGGQFDEARDSAERLAKLSNDKPGSILVAEDNGNIVGAVTIFEDGRSAWLYRFAVKKDEETEATKLLFERAKEMLKQWGHAQVVVYAPVGDKSFESRYFNLGFAKGNDFTAYWQNLN